MTPGWLIFPATIACVYFLVIVSLIMLGAW
ncbi:hypothetical protein ABIA06_001723 [Bradyrhizobium yuanmingense]|uniref:Uncharacterized protein n=1 Tax=Bradyrhizobium yuanmingense TaxID=108015 RepID=A0ABV4GRE0_9BRAD